MVNSWRADRRKVMPHSATAVLQVRLQLSEKQSVIPILAPHVAASFFHQILDKTMSQKPLTFHKTQNEALEDSIVEQTACRPSVLVTRQQKHTQKIDQSACLF